MNVRVERFAYTPMGVFGEMILPEFRCYTVERPWLDNKPSVSCVPEGTYNIKKGFFNRGNYSVYELLDVPGRSLIKIHIANTMDDVIGCIGVGKGLGYVDSKWAVTRSRMAHDEFMAAMGDVDEGTIKIARGLP